VISRVAAQARRQIRARCIDGGLHIARSAIDVAIESELQGDTRRTHRALRGHFGDVGNLSEVTLKRTGNAVSDRIGTRSGQARLHRDSRKVDLRQRSDRKLDECKYTGERHAYRKQRGRNGAFDKGT
jgi:hypothetical protein